LRFLKAPVRFVAPVLAIFAVLVLSAADWPTYLGDVSRSGAGTDTTLTTANAAQLTKLWNFTTGGVIAASASVATEVINGTSTPVVYVGSWDGFEYALNANTGAQIWKTNLGITSSTQCKAPPSAGISSAAAIVNGVVYVGGGDSNWYALDATTGAVLWKIFTGDNSTAGGHYNWASPLIATAADGHTYAYIGISSFGDCPLVQGQLMQVDINTQTLVHTWDVVANGHVGGGIWTSPAYDAANNEVWVTTGTIAGSGATFQYEESIVALNATNICANWSTPNASVCGSTFSSTAPNKAAAFWQLPSSDRVNDSDWGTTPTIYTDENGNQMVSAINKNGYAYAWNRNTLTSTGSVGWVWKKQVATGGVCPTCGDGSVSSSAYDSVNHMLFLSGGHTTINGSAVNGFVRGVDPATGNFIWQHGMSNPVIPALAFDNGLVAVAAGATFSVLNSSSGAQLYSTNPGSGTFYGAPSFANGEIFAGSTNKNLYAFGISGGSPPPPPPPPPSCPTGWNCTDIGTVTPAGNQSVSGNAWTVTGGGSDIWGTADQFHYIWQSMTNSNSVSAHVSSITITNAWTKGGVMLRSSTSPGSPYYAVYVTPANGIVVQYRSAQGGVAVMAASIAGTAPQYLQVADTTANALTAYTSLDGVTWTPIAKSTVTLSLGTSILGGVALTSHQQGTAATLGVDSVTVGSTGGAPPPPPGCPTNWNCADIGGVFPPDPAGSESLSGGAWTVAGSGGDIFGTSDQFHYVWTLPAQADNQSIVAHVDTQQNTNAWAKAGVMFRLSSDPGAPEYAMLVTPSNGLVVQWRSAQGGTTARISTLLGVSAPPGAWVMITRTIDSNGVNTFTAYTSSDGSSWTMLSGSQIVITPAFSWGAMYEGLAVTSHQWNATSTVTMDSVAPS
jgi:outer membrane protein assembly factor BamB